MSHRYLIVLAIVLVLGGALVGALVPTLATERTSCFTVAGDNSESVRAANEDCFRLMLTSREGWQVVRQTKVSESTTVFNLERPRWRLPA